MKIFLSTPISSFTEEKELTEYKNSINSLILSLRKKHSICSEIEKISTELEYDTPEKSIVDDYDAILTCDVFIMHYPKRVPSSALIELGFAIAFNKHIIIVTPSKKILPYLALGISAKCQTALIIENNNLDSCVADHIMQQLDSF